VSPDLKKLYILVLGNNWKPTKIRPSYGEKYRGYIVEIVSPGRMIDTDIYLYKAGQ
jgi:hypothetical protein